jgi:hypothetical protein
MDKAILRRFEKINLRPALPADVQVEIKSDKSVVDGTSTARETMDIIKNNGDSRKTHECGGEKRGEERGCAH